MRTLFVYAALITGVCAKDILFAVSQGEGGSGALIKGPSLVPLRKVAQITNQGSTPLSGAKIYYTGETYDTKAATLVPTISPGETKFVPFLLDSPYFVKIADIPRTTSYKLVSSDGKSLGQASANMDISWFKGVLGAPHFDPSKYTREHFNLLLFGEAGSGKSSYYNSILRMLQSATDGFAGVNIEPALGGLDHVTLGIKALDVPGLPVKIWDTYGLAHDTWQGGELEMLMDGKLPNGWRMDADIRLARSDEVAEFTNAPHAVLVFVNYNQIHDLHGDFMKNLKKQIVNIVRKGVNPILMITKLDKHADAACLKTNWLCAPSFKEDARQDAADAFGLPPGNVYTNINYLDFETKDVEVDRNLWTTFHRAMSNAMQWLENLQQQTTKTSAPTGGLIMQKLQKLEKDLNDQEREVGRLQNRVKDLNQDLARCEEEKDRCEEEKTLAQNTSTNVFQQAVDLLLRLLATVMMLLLGYLLYYSNDAQGLILQLLAKVLSSCGYKEERNPPMGAPPAPAPTVPAPTNEEIRRADMDDVARAEVEADLSAHAASDGVRTIAESYENLTHEELSRQ